MLQLPSNCKEILRNNSFSLITNSSHPSKCVHSFLSKDTTLNTKELPSKFLHYMFTEMSPLTIQQFNHHSWHNSPNPKQPKNKSPHFYSDIMVYCLLILSTHTTQACNDYATLSQVIHHMNLSECCCPGEECYSWRSSNFP